MRERSSNFELLRIVSMIMIIAHHYVYYGVERHHILEHPIKADDIFSSLLLPGGVVGVAIFFMIFGYFGVNKNTNNIQKVLIPTIIYVLFGYIIFMFLDGVHIDLKEIVTQLFPINNQVYWFVTAYLVLMFIKPELNKLFDTKREMILLIMFLFIEYFMGRWVVTNLFSFFQAAFYYCIGAYIKLYAKKMKSYISIIAFVCGWIGYVLMINTSYIPLSGLIGVCIMGTISAFGLFTFFEKHPINMNKQINLLGAVTFDVYLLHEYPLLRKYLWSGIPQQYASRFYPLLGIFTVLIIWLSASFLAVFMRKIIIKPISERLK